MDQDSDAPVLVDIVERALRHQGAVIELDRNQADAATYLHHALTSHAHTDPEIISVLVRNWVNLNVMDADGRNYLSILVENENNMDVIAILVRGGADLNAADHHGRPPLWYLMRCYRCFQARRFYRDKERLQRDLTNFYETLINLGAGLMMKDTPPFHGL